LEKVKKDEEAAEYRKRFVWWKVVIRWMFRLCSGGGTV
jgi:hypothetical protein